MGRGREWCGKGCGGVGGGGVEVERQGGGVKWKRWGGEVKWKGRGGGVQNQEHDALAAW